MKMGRSEIRFSAGMVSLKQEWKGEKKRLVCFKYLELEEGWTIQMGRDCQRLGLLLPREVWGIDAKQTED